MSKHEEMLRRSDEHGYIMRDGHLDYGDLIEPGKIEIRKTDHQVAVLVSDFEFGEDGSCRQQVTKAMCWARDVLSAAIENNRIVPGGGIVSVEASGAPKAHRSPELGKGRQ